MTATYYIAIGAFLTALVAFAAGTLCGCRTRFSQADTLYAISITALIISYLCFALVSTWVMP